MKKLPPELLIYISDWADGKPVFCCAENVEEIPEDVVDHRVGVYVLNRTCKFSVKRELK